MLVVERLTYGQLYFRPEPDPVRAKEVCRWHLLSAVYSPGRYPILHHCVPQHPTQGCVSILDYGAFTTTSVAAKPAPICSETELAASEPCALAR